MSALGRKRTVVSNFLTRFGGFFLVPQVSLARRILVQMKTKVIAIMLGIFLCETAQAEWVEFGTSNEGLLYYDSKRIVYMLDEKVAIWGKITLNEAAWEKPRLGNYAYSVAKNVFNCASKQYNIMSHHEYSIDNKLLVSHKYPAEEQPNDVLPGTIAEALMKIACKKE